VRAVIFDISGTTMDFGSRAPVTAFVELFASRGVTITEGEARRPMGLHKRDHVRALLSDPAISARWAAVHGAPPGEPVLEELYAGFGEIQIRAIRRHLDVIPGATEVCAMLRARGIRIGSTTGFESSMLADIIPAAAAQGYAPDCWMTPDRCGGGRPAPWMMFEAARALGVYPLSRIVKVGDTPADIEEARNAGAWAVTVAVSGNAVGLSREEWIALPAAAQFERLEAARSSFLARGAHAVIDTIAGLEPALEAIELRIARGEKP
jgi:phosphonoacetaldehyde hydrolase